jgi:DNA-binding transcriptional MerR regulator
MDNRSPLYGLQTAKELLGVEAGFIRTMELEGLIKPIYHGGARLFSAEHLHWLACLRYMVQDMGIGIPGLGRLLEVVPCWQISRCKCDTREKCRSRRFSEAMLAPNRDRGGQIEPPCSSGIKRLVDGHTHSNSQQELCFQA